MIKLTLWAFWNCYYAFKPEETDFARYLKRTTRTLWPWRTFIPNAWHNKAGKQWDISFEDASCHSGNLVQITVDVDFANDDGRIVGLTIWDSELKRIQEAR